MPPTDSASPASIQQLKQRAIRGVVSLVVRQGLLKLIGFVAGVFLARILTPEAFGLFAIITFVVKSTGFFAEIGLGAAIIRKPSVSASDLTSVFTVQQGLVLALVLLLSAAAPWVTALFGLDPGAAAMIQVMSVSLLATSLGTIPSLLLERALRFDAIAAIDVAASLAYQLLALGLALLGLGAWSFVWAALASSVVRSAAAFTFRPWRPALGIQRPGLRELLGFGIAFRLNALLSMLKNAYIPILVGGLYGSAELGWVNFGFQFAMLPYVLVPMVSRVAYPAYSQIRKDPARMRAAVEKTLKFVNVALAPTVVFLMINAEAIVRIVYTDKWLPALPVFYLVAPGVLVAAVTNTLFYSLAALGETRALLRLTAIQAVAIWGCTLALLPFFGLIAVPTAATVALVVSLPFAVRELRSRVEFRLWQPIWPSTAGAVLVGFALLLASRYAGRGLLPLASVAGAASLMYLTFLYAVEGKALFGEIRAAWSHV